jgi:type IV pilus assembly protein PilO
MSGLLETLNRISSAQKVLILLLLMIAIGILFYVVIYSSLETDIEAAKVTKNTLLTEETNIKRKVANREDLEASLVDLRTRKEKIEKVLPHKAEIPKLLQKIYGQAKIVGLKIKRFEPNNEHQQDLYTEIPVSIALEGSYDQTADFFYYVGRMERIVNIKEISMERSSGGQYGQGNLEVSCQATTYRSGGKATPAAAK